MTKHMFLLMYRTKIRIEFSFFRKLHGLLQLEDLDSEENIILGGDFNCPLNPALDKHGGGCLKNNQYLVLKGAFCLRKGYSNQITSYAKGR